MIPLSCLARLTNERLTHCLGPPVRVPARRGTLGGVSTSALAEQYTRQERWRRWDAALARLPLVAGQRVLDLGCGVGHVTGLLASRGVAAVGVDADEELLSAARARHRGPQFELGDVRALAAETSGVVEGLWASFVCAYLDPLPAVIERWSRCLAPGGWIALVEVDDLLGHAPLAAEHVQAIQALYADARRAHRYDFLAGRELAGAVRAAGLRVIDETVLEDDELSFSGSAPPEVLAAWGDRLARMPRFRQLLGTGFPRFERAFLDALASPEHRSTGRVMMVVAERAR